MDGAHGAPKRDLRNYFSVAGAGGLYQLDNEVGGFNHVDQIPAYLRSLGNYDVDIDSQPDSKGFRLMQRCTKTFDPSDGGKQVILILSYFIEYEIFFLILLKGCGRYHLI